MDKSAYRTAAYDLIGLISSVLNEPIAVNDKSFYHTHNSKTLFNLHTVAEAHSLTAITSYALEANIVNDK